MTFRPHLILLACLAVGLNGCASSAKTQADDTLDQQMTDQANDDSSLSSFAQSASQSQDPHALGNEQPQSRLLYFDFDQSSIRPQDLETLRQHAAYLKQNPQTRVRLEGHADERGTREYNMGLGERRALTVQKSLLIMGVQAQQLMSVSYGEEKPLRLGASEDSFQENRRVELVYPTHMTHSGDATLR